MTKVNKSNRQSGKVAATAIPAEKPAEDVPERIAKRMSRAGLCSRREAERWILDGRVTVNGKKLETPAHTVTKSDKIEVDGKLVAEAERTRLWMFHKKAGLVTTNRDPEGRKTVFEVLPQELPRVLSVGRLDINTEGLLLLTNDGGLARTLELPSTGWLRRYRVRAFGKITQEELDKLQNGKAVDGVLYGAIHATLDKVQANNLWMTLSFREGKNREVKNVLRALGLEVNRLIRISYGPFQLGELSKGQVQEIRGRILREQLGTKLIEASGADFDAPIYQQTQVVEEEKPKKWFKPVKPAGKSRQPGKDQNRPTRGKNPKGSPKGDNAHRRG